MMKRTLCLALLFAVATTSLTYAELKVGDDAPKLHVSKWIKGEPVDLSKAKADDVYVIEFWATWCGPCRAGMPHLSDLQDHFKSKHLTVIAITDETKSVVKKFLSDGWDAKMRFTIAIDKKNKSWKAWMDASQQQGIPTAFVVKGGKILWIGHSGDPKMELTIADACGDKAYAAKTKKLIEAQEKLYAAVMEEKWVEAMKLVDTVIALKPDEDHLKALKYSILVSQIKDSKEAEAYGRALVKECDSAEMLNAISWGILTDAEYEGVRDIKLATSAAEKAMKLSEKKDPAIIDTFARALMMSGDLKGAIKWQKEAVKLCEEGPMKEELKKALDDYVAMTEKPAKGDAKQG